MDCNPRLRRQQSCATATIDIAYWWGSGRRTASLRRSLPPEELQALNHKLGRPAVPLWQAFWRKLKREKAKIFHSPTQFQVPYDPYTYSQNFDHGSATLEPDNLSRSFSARFADPSRSRRLQRFG